MVFDASEAIRQHIEDQRIAIEAQMKRSAERAQREAEAASKKEEYDAAGQPSSSATASNNPGTCILSKYSAGGRGKER